MSSMLVEYLIPCQINDQFDVNNRAFLSFFKRTIFPRVLIEKESCEPYAAAGDMTNYSLLLVVMIFQLVALDLVMLS